MLSIDSSIPIGIPDVMGTRAPYLSFSDRVASHGRWYGEDRAVVDGERVIRWKQLDESANRIANGLSSAGLVRGDKVGILLGNCAEYIEIIAGTVRAGCACVPFSLMLTPRILTRLIAHSGIRALFVSAESWHLVEDFRMELSDMGVVCRVVLGNSADPQWRRYSAWLASVPATDPEVELLPDDEMSLIYSSGTTGIPKGIVHTHRGRDHLWALCAQQLEIRRRSVTLVLTGMYTNGTWTTMMPTLAAGGCVIVMKSFNAEEFLRLSEAHRVTHAFVVPASLRQALDHPDFLSRDLSSYRVLFCTGSALTADLRKRALAAFAADLIEAYGLTEGFGTFISVRTEAHKFGSVGRVACGSDIKIFGPEDRQLPRGDVGEIVGFSDCLMKEYFRDPQATQEALWIDHRKRCYVRTGDLGCLDADGYLFLKDRRKDLIISGGLNVFASDLEEALRQHPQVHEVAVIALEDSRWGETPLALVQPKEGTVADTEAIRRWANERLAKFQRISRVELVSDFPRNALGKILKAQLRERYANDKELNRR